VNPGETGFAARDEQEFVAGIRELATQPGRLQMMRAAARTHAMTASWDRVFESIYLAYERSLRSQPVPGKKIRMRAQAMLP